jgi:uncharacterized protein YabN with tetrapyrrole methylase and pyrophosphatase domain
MPEKQMDSSKRKSKKIKNKKSKGSLLIVGVGIKAVRHVTLEARESIKNYDKVLYLIGDPIAEIWIEKLRPDAESLLNFYKDGKNRHKIYSEIVEHTLNYVRRGYNTCLVQYGHPSLFAKLITQSAIEKAHNEGFKADILPGISAEDCLFAELCIDPGDRGCQSFEATNFLVYNRKFDPFCHLILWQIGLIGEFQYNPNKNSKSALCVLTDYLKRYYDSKHEVYVYQAARYSICKSLIQRIPLHKLPEAYVDITTTLYIPPIVPGEGTLDHKMVQRLGITAKD